MKRVLFRRTHKYEDKNRLDEALRGSVSRIVQETPSATKEAEQA